MSPRVRLIVLSISTPLLAFAIVGGSLGKSLVRDDTYRHLRVFEDVISLISNNYVEEVEADKILGGAMRGLAENLDPDSAYLSAEQVIRLEAAEAGSTVPTADVGIALTRRYYLRVLSVLDGSPAARAGLVPGDYIRGIDDQPTRTMSVFEGTRRLRGEVGSQVSLTVIRGNAADPHAIELVREPLPEPTVSGRIAGPGVGYLRIPSFDADVVDQVEQAAADLVADHATSLIVDVRRTAGGALESGLSAARLFVADGTLASLDRRGADPRPVLAGQGEASITLPVLILINGGTAGASELFAAALAGNARAELVGEGTIGRAGVQELVKLPDGSGLWLTRARYLDPAGEPIHGVGLTPDIPVDAPVGELGDPPADEDPILDEALERLALKDVA